MGALYGPDYSRMAAENRRRHEALAREQRAEAFADFERRKRIRLAAKAGKALIKPERWRVPDVPFPNPPPSAKS